MSSLVRFTLKNGHLSKAGVKYILLDLFSGLRLDLNDVNRYYPDVAIALSNLYNVINSLKLK